MISEYLRIFHLLKCKFQNYLIIWWTYVEMAKVLGYFVGFALLGKAIGFGFIIEFSSLWDLGS
jgi:hypothetical protein